MDTNSIRRAFIDFFTARGHVYRPSASLIPVDPTLLLTNAGMVPFKPYFLGEEPAPYARAVTAQKCARTVDIDIVGTTTGHVTLFEMLGNFSFGDYFKEQAIPWAYEFVTEHLELDPEVLWYTVHHTDDEAEQIWIDGVGVPTDRVQRGGNDNFWQMGVPGPCGPSSEIFVDRGPEFGHEGGPIGGDESRYLEIWNLVFMQNLQDEPYHVIGDLPAKNIDTGMGLERTAAILQGVHSVFDVDSIRPVLDAGAAYAGVAYGDDPMQDVSLRIMADHGRAITFLMADGVVPSNEGRGYILRRLLRRVIRHAWRLGGEQLVTPVLVDRTIEVMSDPYPELADHRALIVEMSSREEHRFRRTLESGHNILEAELGDVDDGGTLSGSTAFKLHDTYGFPVELTAEIAAERGLDVDLDGFAAEMDAQRERARAAWRGGAAAQSGELWRDLLGDIPPTDFVGYVLESSRSVILSLVRDGETVEKADEDQEVEVFLDSSPFYAEQGGQVGDTGWIVTPTGKLQVTDTQFRLPGVHGHRATVVKGYVESGQDVDGSIDALRREGIRKSHTGTHLLHWALREVLGSHARQAGSLVEAGRLRFDISHFAATAYEELVDVERLANERVIENARVETVETSLDQARQMGALAFFGDKYGEHVRVVKAGEYSKELCAGTHTPSTGQVGPLVVVSESSIGANLRRVEALTGEQGFAYLNSLRRQLERVAHDMRAKPGQVADRVEALMSRNRELEKQLRSLEQQKHAAQAGRLADEAEEVGPYRLLVAHQPDTPPDALRALAIQLRDRLGDGVVVVGTVRDGKGSMVATVSSSLVASGVSAGEILHRAAGIMGGGGSRDPELAQAGGPDGERLDEALEAARTDARGAMPAP